MKYDELNPKSRVPVQKRTFTSLRKATVSSALNNSPVWTITPITNVFTKMHQTSGSNGNYAYKITGPNLSKAKRLLTQKKLFVVEKNNYLIVSNEDIGIE